MKIAVLGKGVEGNAVAEYFKNDEITFFEKFTDEELDSFGLENFDLVFRSPSVHPLYLAKQKSPHLIDNWTTITNIFLVMSKLQSSASPAPRAKGLLARLSLRFYVSSLRNSSTSIWSAILATPPFSNSTKLPKKIL